MAKKMNALNSWECSPFRALTQFHQVNRECDKFASPTTLGARGTVLWTEKFMESKLNESMFLANKHGTDCTGCTERCTRVMAFNFIVLNIYFRFFCAAATAVAAPSPLTEIHLTNIPMRAGPVIEKANVAAALRLCRTAITFI